MTEQNLAADVAAELKKRQRGPRCGVRVLLASYGKAHGAEAAEELREMIEGRMTSIAALSAVLRSRGFECPADTLNRHARHDCKCWV